MDILKNFEKLYAERPATPPSDPALDYAIVHALRPFLSDSPSVSHTIACSLIDEWNDTDHPELRQAMQAAYDAALKAEHQK